jgi:indole-3-glycerol phosphate synthase
MNKFLKRHNHLNDLARNSYRALNEGVYNAAEYDYGRHEAISLKKSIVECPHAPLIAEIKFASPSKGKIVEAGNRKIHSVLRLASMMVESGSIGLSILTQPYLFEGSPEYLGAVRKTTSAPLLMKDIIVSETQIDSAKRLGADCVLLIKSLFDNNLTEGSIEKFVEYTTKRGLQLVLEVHSEEEFKEVLGSSVDTKLTLIGINNRDLHTLSVDVETTSNLLKKYDKGKNMVISESGISKPEEIQLLKKAGADAFLIGTSIMESDNISSKISELYFAL